MVGAKDDRLAVCPIVDADLCRTRHTIPPIPLPLVAMPGFDHACCCGGDICLAKPVRVIRCAVDLRELAALIKVGGQWAKLG